MGHAHCNHGHHGHDALQGKSLGFSIGLNAVITGAQAVVGLRIGSLSLLSDALHNFSDVFALIISYIAFQLARREHTLQQTFGYKRAEIIAALVNIVSLLVIAYFILVAAYHRLQAPVPIESEWVMYLAGLGIAANGLCAYLLKKSADSNLNMRSAYLHLFTDMLTSVAVLLGAVLMYFFERYWIDSALSIVIAVYLAYSSWGILMQILRVLMQFSPTHIDLHAIQQAVTAFPQVDNLHHAHVWQLTDREVHFEAHIDFKENLRLSEATKILQDIRELLTHKYDIRHTLLQAEYGVDDSKKLIVDERP